MSILLRLTLSDTTDWDGTTVADLSDDEATTSVTDPIVILGPQRFGIVFRGAIGVIFMADLFAMLQRRLPIQLETGQTQTPVESLALTGARNAEESTDVWVERVFAQSTDLTTFEPGLHSPPTLELASGARIAADAPPAVAVVAGSSFMFGATGQLDDTLPANNAQGPLYVPNGYALYLESTSGGPIRNTVYLTCQIRQNLFFGFTLYA